jgi:hypothetical protein
MKYLILTLALGTTFFTGCKKESSPAPTPSCTLNTKPQPTSNVNCNLATGSVAACLGYDDGSLLALALAGTIGNCYLVKANLDSNNMSVSSQVTQVANGCATEANGQYASYFFFINNIFVADISLFPEGTGDEQAALALKNAMVAGKCGLKAN